MTEKEEEEEEKDGLTLVVCSPQSMMASSNTFRGNSYRSSTSDALSIANCPYSIHRSTAERGREEHVPTLHLCPSQEVGTLESNSFQQNFSIAMIFKILFLLPKNY